MGVIDLSAYKPVPSTLGDANQVANGFQAIQNLVNGSIDNNNFAAGRIFDPAKIMQNAALAGDGLVWDATNLKWVPYSTAPAGSKNLSGRAKSTVAQSIANNTLTGVTLSATDWLNGGTTFGSSAITVPVAGIYLMNVIVSWSNGSVAGSIRYVQMRRQNSLAVVQEQYEEYRPPEQGGFFTAYATGAVMQAAAGDSFYFMAQQDSGGALNLNSAFMSVSRLG